MMSEIDIFKSLVIALGISLLIGIERGWQRRETAKDFRIARVRTFSLIGLMGGVMALLDHMLSRW